LPNDNDIIELEEK